jgi:hypothetical protein
VPIDSAWPNRDLRVIDSRGFRMQSGQRSHVLASDENAAIGSRYQGILDRSNDRDADAFAARFAADGSLAGLDGSRMTGRSEIADCL